MTEKRFTIMKSNFVEDGWFIKDNLGNFVFGTTNERASLIVIEKQLNELAEENEHLKKELKGWKYNCSSSINENSILWNEIAIMREQGAKPSSAFEEYCSKFKGDVE